MKKYMILACLMIGIGSADRVLASGGSPKYICKKKTLENSKKFLGGLAVIPATYFTYTKLCEYIPAEYLWIGILYLGYFCLQLKNLKVNEAQMCQRLFQNRVEVFGRRFAENFAEVYQEFRANARGPEGGSDS